MKRVIVATLLAVALVSNTGCFLPIFSADPAERTSELLVVSENHRAMKDSWRRLWFLDHSDLQSPTRTNGVIF